MLTETDGFNSVSYSTIAAEVQITTVNYVLLYIFLICNISHYCNYT